MKMLTTWGETGSDFNSSRGVAFTQYCLHGFCLPTNILYILIEVSRNSILIQEND